MAIAPNRKLKAASNLADLLSASTARTNLGLGTAAVLNVGTGANQVVQLNGSGQLPAVSGALLTDLPASAASLSGLTAASAGNTIANGDNAQVWQWALTTAGKIAFNFTESAASTATGTAPLVQINTLASSTAIALLVKSKGVECFRTGDGSDTGILGNSNLTTPYSFTGSVTSGIGWASSSGVYFVEAGAGVAYFKGSSGVGIGTATFPASLTNGITMADGNAPTANPGDPRFSMWCDDGQFAYRSSVTSEGAGQTNRVHNRTANMVGVGTDYTLTASMAKIDFGTTDNDITLPSAGTYLLIAQVAYIADSAGALDNVQLKLRNSTDSTDVGTTRSYAGFATISTLLQLTETVTVTAASKVIQIHAVNNTSARGVIDSVQTTLHYVRLH